MRYLILGGLALACAAAVSPPAHAEMKYAFATIMAVMCQVNPTDAEMSKFCATKHGRAVAQIRKHCKGEDEDICAQEVWDDHWYWRD